MNSIDPTRKASLDNVNILLGKKCFACFAPFLPIFLHKNFLKIQGSSSSSECSSSPGNLPTITFSTLLISVRVQEQDHGTTLSPTLHLPSPRPGFTLHFLLAIRKMHHSPFSKVHLPSVNAHGNLG